MDTCEWCGQPLKAGDAIVKLTDATQGDEYDFEVQNTETYHARCIIISNP